jgi:hypothetical protein
MVLLYYLAEQFVVYQRLIVMHCSTGLWIFLQKPTHQCVPIRKASQANSKSPRDGRDWDSGQRDIRSRFR